MRDHRKLKAFELIDAMVIDIYEATKSFPKLEQFGLTAQIRRAIVSAASNIVEGCPRGSQKDYVRFLEIAHGSLREAGYQLGIAKRLNYLDSESFNVINKQYSEAARVLAGLVKSNRKTKM